MQSLTALFFLALPLVATALSRGVTTRYWDCCKSSCSWPGKANVNHPVKTCNIHNNVLRDYNAQSACAGGNSYMCANQSPIVINKNLSYGYAAVKLSGKQESDWCCACYELTFTSGPVAGKKMVVQATNTGGDLGSNHFDLAIPGGGVGQFNACTKQYGAPLNGWGMQYGGISRRSDCNSFPLALKAGCRWRFDWFKNADNPSVSFRKVICPRRLTERTGCRRK